MILGHRILSWLRSQPVFVGGRMRTAYWIEQHVAELHSTKGYRAPRVTRTPIDEKRAKRYTRRFEAKFVSQDGWKPNGGRPLQVRP